MSHNDRGNTGIFFTKLLKMFEGVPQVNDEDLHKEEITVSEPKEDNNMRILRQLEAERMEREKLEVGASESGEPGNLFFTTVKWIAVFAGIKGATKLYHTYQMMQADRSVRDLHNAFSNQPRLLTNGPHSVQIVDDTGMSSLKSAAPSPSRRSAETRASSTIRILSVTSRTPTAWIKDENRSGLYQVERTSGKVHLFIQPRWLLSPSLNPACTELETYLRIRKIPYNVHIINVLRAEDALGGAREEDVPQEEKSDLQKESERLFRQKQLIQTRDRPLPFIIYKGELVVGSFDVITRFIDQKFNLPPAVYTSEDKNAWAMAQAVSRTLEYTLRMQYKVNMLLECPFVFSKYAGGAMGVPAPVMWLWVSLPFFSKLKTDVRKSLKAHDLGYLTKDQLNASFMQQMQLLEKLLESTPENFLFGKEPNKEDCTLYAYLMPIVRLNESDLHQANNECFNFIARSAVFRTYVANMSAVAFPNFERMVGHLIGTDATTAAIAKRQREQMQRQQERRRKSTLEGSMKSETKSQKSQNSSNPPSPQFPQKSKKESVAAPSSSSPTAAARNPAPSPQPQQQQQQPQSHSARPTVTHAQPHPKSSTPAPATAEPSRDTSEVPVRNTTTLRNTNNNSGAEFEKLTASAIRKTRPPRGTLQGAFTPGATTNNSFTEKDKPQTNTAAEPQQAAPAPQKEAEKKVEAAPAKVTPAPVLGESKTNKSQNATQDGDANGEVMTSIKRTRPHTPRATTLPKANSQEKEKESSHHEGSDPNNNSIKISSSKNATIVSNSDSLNNTISSNSGRRDGISPKSGGGGAKKKKASVGGGASTPRRTSIQSKPAAKSTN